MTLYRYVSPVIAFGVVTGLLACTQPSASVQPATQPPAQSNHAQSNLEPKPQTKQADSSHTFEACFNLVAYDPADTSVNLRDQPDGSVIDSLPNFSQVQMEGPAGIDSGWNHVYVVGSNTQGYVWGDLLHRSYYQVADPQDSFANLRRSPNGPVVTAVENETAVRFLGIMGEWTRVSLTSGQAGYIHSALLAPPSCF